jgi:hypothetical protein
MKSHSDRRFGKQLLYILPLILLLACTIFCWLRDTQDTGSPRITENRGELAEPIRESSDLRVSKEFRSWLNSQVATDPQKINPGPPPDLQDGIRLATERRKRIERLIREDPQQAIAESLTWTEWQSLPEALRSLVERPFSTVANYAYYPVCLPPGSTPVPGAPNYIAELQLPDGQSLQTFVYGTRSDLGSKRSLPAQGIMLDGLAALRPEVIQTIPDSDVEAARKSVDTTQADSGRSFANGEPVGTAAVHALVGGRLVVFSNEAEALAANQRLTAAESRPGTLAATSYLLPSGDAPIDWDALETFADVQASTWTETKKKVFLIRINFSNNTAEPVTQAAASGVLNGTVSDQIRANSYGKTWIEATVSANLYTMPQITTYYTGSGLNTELLRDARNTFRTHKSGADASINIGLVSASGSGDAGLGDYDIVGVTFSSIGISSGGVTYAGLAGGRDLWLQGNNSSGVFVHEFGHNYGIGHASSWDTTNGSVAGTGTSDEYGDIFDIMGNGGDPEGQFHTQAKSKLDWLTIAQWADATALGSNTYRVHRIDDADTTSSTLRGVRVTKAAGEYYWLGYRTAFTSNNKLEKGIYLNWQRPGETRCWLLDTTPNSLGGKSDSPLSLGRTYSDGEANLHLTPLATGGSGADRWIDVRVNLGLFSGNSAPVAGAISGPSTVAARTSVNLASAATDSNGDTLSYFWDTKDGTVHQNSSSITHNWITGGTYQVSLTVSDMKGGTQTVTKTITVTDPLDTWTQQTTNNTGYLHAAVWGKDRFVIAEIFGTVLTSWDGVTWTNVGDLPDFELDPKLAFGMGMFVAAGKKDGVATSQICYSPDGRSWSTANFPAGVPQIRDVASSASGFVALGDSGAVLNSPDGINWSFSTVSGNPNFAHLTHNGSVWMAVSTKVASANDETVWTSINGISWSQQGDLGFDVHDLAGKAGKLYASGWYGGIKSSADNGVSWQAASTPGTTRWSTGQIAISPDGTFLVTAKAMDESGAPQALLVSANGTEWTRSSAGTTFAWDSYALVAGFGRFLTSADGGIVRTSSSLYPANNPPSASLALAPASPPARSSRLYAGTATDSDGDALTYYWDFGLPGLITDGSSVVKSFDFGGTYNGTFRVSDGKGGLTTLTQSVTVSDPARQFTQRTSGTTNPLNAIAANANLAVAVDGYPGYLGSGGVIRTSVDGITWTTHTVASAPYLYFEGAAWDGSKFIIVGWDYNFNSPIGWQGVIYTSPDGINWTRRFGGGDERNNELYAVATGGGGMVAVGNNGAILQSTDGSTWNSVTVAALSASTLGGVAFGNSTFVLTGYATAGSGTPRVFTSTDRTSWMDVTAGAGLDSWQDLRKTAWLNDRFVSSGWYSKLRTSTTSGTTFTTSRSDREQTPALAFGDGIYFAGGINFDASSADIDLLSLDGTTWTRSTAPTTNDRYGAVFFKHTIITVGEGGSIWQSADLTPSISVTNQPPTFAGYSATTPPGTPLVIPRATLVSATTDPDGDTVLLTATTASSTQGGSLSLGGPSVTYVPANNYSGADSFQVTFTDARGATTLGTVQVTVQPSNTVPPGPMTLTFNAGGQAQFSFQGTPELTYTIQRSTTLVNWALLTTATASPSGAVTFSDPNPPPGKAFYRIALP